MPGDPTGMPATASPFGAWPFLEQPLDRRRWDVALDDVAADFSRVTRRKVSGNAEALLDAGKLSSVAHLHREAC